MNWLDELRTKVQMRGNVMIVQILALFVLPSVWILRGVNSLSPLALIVPHMRLSRHPSSNAFTDCEVYMRGSCIKKGSERGRRQL